MTKKNKTPLGIFTESVGLYFSNFNQFVKYMTFPILGQVAGLGLTLFLTLLYAKNLPYLIEKYAVFNNFNTLVLMSALVALPGMAIFMKAFWEYLVAYGSVNSMLENMLKSGKVYDFNAHTELIKRRTPAFVGLWLIFGFFSILAMIPFFWVPAGIIAIYFILIFQVFTFEPELSPIGCFKKSFNLIKGHFAATFLLAVLAGILTWIFVPNILNHLLNITGINNFLAKIVIPFVEIMPIDNLNTYLDKFTIPQILKSDLALLIVTTSLTQIFIQYTLPLRSILWAMWYKELNSSIKTATGENNVKKKSNSKRPSEKLMKESHKKFVTKKIDKNILKRAMEKNDED